MAERITTTFWMDFSIADNFGIDAIKDTFNRAFAEWKDNYKYLTELVMTLNHKSFQWETKMPDYCSLYTDLFYQARDYAYDNMTEEELDFFFEVTD